jgi:hypothetical protein
MVSKIISKGKNTESEFIRDPDIKNEKEIDILRL